MQAEDIIQRKEWAELNSEEKELLLPLASTGEEYNMLKKMFLILDEETTSVPIINPSIQQRLQDKVKPRTISLTKWYYAAAAVLILFFAVYFIQQKNRQPVIAKALPTLEKSVDITWHRPIIKKQADTTVYVKTPSRKPIKTINDPITPNRDYAYVSTRVADDNSLLNFTTEVY